MRARGRCRRETSFTRGEGQGSLTNGLSCVQKGLAHVVGFEVWVQREDLLRRLPLGDERDNGRDGNSEAPKARNAAHLAGVSSDARVAHRQPFYAPPCRGVDAPEVRAWLSSATRCLGPTVDPREDFGWEGLSK